MNRGRWDSLGLSEKNVSETNIPIRTFLYSLEQIEQMIGIPASALAQSYIYFQGRTIGIKRPWMIQARNIAGPDDIPEWRVADREFIRWLRNRGFRVIERGYVKD